MIAGETGGKAMIALLVALALLASPYPWLASAARETIEARIAPPAGFRRVPALPGSFAEWLRGLPVKPGHPPVHLFDGRLKANQTAHYLVLDVDVGTRDRQQCADAVIRLRAEYLRAARAEDRICFRFTSGAPARWSAWREGMRPRIRGNAVTWEKRAQPDASYASFRRYLDVVFDYAGSFSLARELERVPDPRRIQAGDVFIQGGFPGHAVLVVDVAEDAAGRRAVLLAQSYMPAQDIHVLRNPGAPQSPWYVIDGDGPLATPEWRFPPGSLGRFGESSATACQLVLSENRFSTQGVTSWPGPAPAFTPRISMSNPFKNAGMATRMRVTGPMVSPNPLIFMEYVAWTIQSSLTV